MAKKKKGTGSKLSVPAVRMQKMQEAIESMKPALKTVYERIKAKREEMREKAVILAYEIGEDVINVERNQHKYGEKALTQLAVGFGFDPDPKLNPLAKARAVVSAWSRKKVIELMEAAEEYGNEFTLTHFEYLAPLRGEQGLMDRTRLENEVVKLGTPTRELHQQVVLCTRGPIKTNRTGGRPPIVPKNAMACCNEMSKYSRNLKIRWENWDKALFTKVKTTAKEDDPDLLACGIDENLQTQLNQSLDDYVELGENVQRAIGQFRSSIELVERLLAVRAEKGPAGKKRAKPTMRPRGKNTAKAVE